MAGVNRILFNLVTNLPKQFTPIVVIAGEGNVAEVYKSAGIEVKIMPPGPSLNQFGKVMLNWSLAQQVYVGIKELLPYTLKIWKLIKNLKIDIVHINDMRGALLAGLAARMAGCPVVGHLHGEIMFGGIAPRVFEKVSNVIITVCSSIQSSLSIGARKKAITVYNGIPDVSQFGGTIPWLNNLRASGIIIVCCFATVVPFKGHIHLIEAVNELNRRGWRDRVLFICVGDLVPEYKEFQQWLMEQQQELGVNNLFFTGFQFDPYKFFRVADIVVLPSVSKEQLNINGKLIDVLGNEGFPTALLEAMWFGLPVVATDIAGIRELIEDGLNGFIVPPSDKEALAEALEKLLSDQALRIQMGKAGRQRVQSRFSLNTFINRVVDVYRLLLES
jgi:glycosyltransferase involved in cell wall biosynthesis